MTLETFNFIHAVRNARGYERDWGEKQDSHSKTSKGEN